MFDTNVLVSALLLRDSKPRRALDRALHAGQILLSLAALEELYEVLNRKRFRRYFGEEDLRRFLAALTQAARWIEVDIRIAACRDPKDNKFLELAVAGRADVLITGDADLLALHPFRGVQILSPDAFLQSLEKS